MALSADRNTPSMDGYDIALSVAASTTIYAGSVVVVNASGYAVPGVTGTGYVVMGRAEESVVNSGAAGAKTLRVSRNRLFQFANSAGDTLTQASIGQTAYIEDDQTVCKTSTGKTAAGKVFAVETSGVWVWMT